MTINAVDITDESGEPVELFMFAQGDQTWHFTSGLNQVEHLGKKYKPIYVERDEIEQGDDYFSDGVSISFALTEQFAQQFIAYSPDFVTTLTIFRGGYPSGPFSFYWKGRVVAGKSEGNSISLECESSFTSVKRNGLRARYERICRHSLYSPSCGVSEQDHKATGAISSIENGVKITLSSVTPHRSSGYLSGGLAIGSDGAKRGITKHDGNVIEVSRPFNSISVGDTLELFSGCDHSIQTCASKFNNNDNFGGFPFIPDKNPFDKSIV